MHYYYREVPILEVASLSTYVHQHRELELEHPQLTARAIQKVLHLPARWCGTHIEPPQIVYPFVQIAVGRIGQQRLLLDVVNGEPTRFEHRRAKGHLARGVSKELQRQS